MKIDGLFDIETIPSFWVDGYTVPVSFSEAVAMTEAEASKHWKFGDKSWRVTDDGVFTLGVYNMLESSSWTPIAWIKPIT